LKVGNVRLAWVAAVPESFPKDGRPEVCVLGRSNVGKSSLINRLLGQKGIARVSKTPGRTREIHFYMLDERFYLVDLPGFGYANVPEALRRGWATLMQSYFDLRGPTLRLGMQLVDIRHDPTELDIQLGRMLTQRKVPFCLVLTKSDKVSNNHITQMVRRAPQVLELPEGVPVVVTSAASGAGFRELSKVVVDAYAGRIGGSAAGDPGAGPAGAVDDSQEH
jgi:GTP-binding protein